MCRKDVERYFDCGGVGQRFRELLDDLEQRGVRVSFDRKRRHPVIVLSDGGHTRSVSLSGTPSCPRAVRNQLSVLTRVAREITAQRAEYPVATPSRTSVKVAEK